MELNKITTDKAFSKDDSKPFPFIFPEGLKRKAKLICLVRNISLAEFVRQGITDSVNKYSHLIQK